MKQSAIITLSAIALSFATGCAHVYRVAEDPCPGAPVPPPGNRNPRVAVQAKAQDAKAAGLSEAIRASLSDNLAGRGFDVVGKDKPDSTVKLTVSRRTKASLDDWRVYEGTVGASVIDGKTGRLVGSQEFSAEGKRALNETDAEAGVRTLLAKQVAEWVAKKLPGGKVQLPAVGLPNAGLATCRLTIMPEDAEEEDRDVMAVCEKFRASVSAMPGVKSCRLEREDPVYRSRVYLTEYEPMSFPGGLVNEILLNMPKLGKNVEVKKSR